MTLTGPGGPVEVVCLLFIKGGIKDAEKVVFFFLPFGERVAVGERLNAAVFDQEAHLVEERGRQARWLFAQQTVFRLRRCAAGERELAVVVAATFRVHAVDEAVAVVVDVVVAHELNGRLARLSRPSLVADARVAAALMAGHALTEAIATAAVRTSV